MLFAVAVHQQTGVAAPSVASTMTEAEFHARKQLWRLTGEETGVIVQWHSSWGAALSACGVEVPEVAPSPEVPGDGTLRILTADQAAERSGYSKSTIENRAREGKLTKVKAEIPTKGGKPQPRTFYLESELTSADDATSES